MLSSIRPTFICPCNWVWNCYPCSDKTHKTLNTKTYTANNKNNNIKNCSSSRSRDPTVQACKYAHEGRDSSSTQVFAQRDPIWVVHHCTTHTLQGGRWATVTSSPLSSFLLFCLSLLWNILILKAWFQPLGLNDFTGTVRPSEIWFYQQLKAKQEPKRVQFWSWIVTLLVNYLILKIPFWQMMLHFPSRKKFLQEIFFWEISACLNKNNIIFHRTCYSPRVFLMIELEIYWLLSSTLKWDFKVHPYPVIWASSNIYHT